MGKRTKGCDIISRGARRHATHFKRPSKESILGCDGAQENTILP